MPHKQRRRPVKAPPKLAVPRYTERDIVSTCLRAIYALAEAGDLTQAQVVRETMDELLVETREAEGHPAP